MPFVYKVSTSWKPGDRVRVVNYRRKRATPEKAAVEKITAVLRVLPGPPAAETEIEIIYTCLLDRKTNRGKDLRLHITNLEKIKPL